MGYWVAIGAGMNTLVALGHPVLCVLVALLAVGGEITADILDRIS